MTTFNDEAQELQETMYIEIIKQVEKNYKELADNQVEIEKKNKELEETREELSETNKEINKNRGQLKDALDKISSLIQSVIQQNDISVRFNNPNLKECYTLMGCKKSHCPCYGKEPVRCWKEVGTFCGGKITGDFTKKQENCTKCPVFKHATSDPIYEIGENFNNMMHVVEMRNRELENAYKEVSYAQAKAVDQEKMAAVGQLAAGVAHEINNPTGFISSNLKTLGRYLDKLTMFINAQGEEMESMKLEAALERLEGVRKKLKIDYVIEDVGGLINESIDGAERIARIVQNLKTFSRMDESDYKMADINECIESTLNIVWNELKYNVVVEKEYGDIPLTKCCPHELNQVFMNLLVNAGHAIEKMGEIIIKTRLDGDFINILIADTGEGIPEDIKEKIFEPFFTTKEAGKGTGLGLSISYDLIKKNKGDISVESETGRGTAFNIKIPVVGD